MMKRTDSMCFGCGPDNPIGLHLHFDFNQQGELVTVFVPEGKHQGYDAMMHGGLMAVLLDEVMGKLLTLRDIKAFTARMETRYRRAVPIGEKLIVTGRIVFDKGRMIEMSSDAKNEDGETVAEAKARFMKA